MSTLGVVAALPAEGRALTGEFQSADTTMTSIPGLMLGLCGVGQQAAERTARALIEQGAEALVSWGCAAGLTVNTVPGLLFLPTRIVDQAGRPTHEVDTAWHTCLTRTLQNAGLRFETSALVSVNTMLTGPDAKQQLHKACGATVADMESAAIAAVAAAHRQPFLCVRAVADDLSVTLPPELPSTLDHFGRPRTIELLRLLLGRPAIIPQILKLGRAFGQARRTLAMVADKTDRKLAYDTCLHHTANGL